MPYLEGGEEIEVLAKFDGGYAVNYLYDNDDEGPSRGDPFIATKVYEEPPCPRLDAKISATEAKLKTTRERLRQIDKAIVEGNTKIIELRHEYEKLNDPNQIPAGMLAAKRILEGKIKYYVIDSYYGAGIYAPKDVPREYGRGINVLMLRVTDKGELEWLQQYSSDRKEQVYPCLTIEDAREKCLELLVDNYCREPRQVEYIIDHAKSAGVILPQNIQDTFKKLKDQEAAEKRASLEKAKFDAETALAALTKGTP